MLGLEDATKEYRVLDYSVTHTAEDEYHPGENKGSGGWFPFLQSGGDFYLLDTMRSDSNICPVIHKFRDSGPAPEFVSMTAMFKTMYDWADEGILRVEDGHLLGDYDGDPVRIGKIAARYNPSIVSWERMAAGVK